MARRTSDTEHKASRNSLNGQHVPNNGNDAQGFANILDPVSGTFKAKIHPGMVSRAAYNVTIFWVSA